MELIGSIIGLVIGGAIFMALMGFIPSMKNHVVVAVVVFLLCWGLGIWITGVALYIAIIVGIVALVVTFIKKRKSIKMPDEIDINQTDNLDIEQTDEITEE